MFKIVHSILRCGETRQAALEFLQKMIKLNAKRAQLAAADRRSFSSDGMMLNLVYVMQQLNSKVKLSSVSNGNACPSPQSHVTQCLSHSFSVRWTACIYLDLTHVLALNRKHDLPARRRS